MAQNQVGKVYMGSNLVFPANNVIPFSISATGGSVVTDGDYKIITFTSDASIEIRGEGTIETLLVGAGGSGGQNAFPPNKGGGGGGGGGVIYGTGLSISAGTYAITIGQGAAAANGGDSSIGAWAVAKGGGRSSTDGGSGGGGDMDGSAVSLPGSTLSGTVPAGATEYGNAGGNATTTLGGGGGGATQVGGNAPYAVNYGGKGGDGFTTTISGASVTYGGGGGGGVGGSISGTPNNGGTGGGGQGSSQNYPGDIGTDYLGGGGGGTFASGAKRGGHGVVIIKYKFQ